MKNFGPEYFFEKPIRIINTKNLNPDSTLVKLKNYDIQFFPEGGNLVQQIESKVGFRITDAYGKGLDCKGSLIDQNEDTLLRFQPLHKGLGHFDFTPEAGQSYKAIIRFQDGQSVTKEIPTVYTSGYAISLSKNQGSQITITVHVSPDLGDPDVLLVIHGQHTAMPVKTGKAY